MLYEVITIGVGKTTLARMLQSAFEANLLLEVVGMIATELFDGGRIDSEAFASVLQAFQLPKETEEEKSARRRAIQARITSYNVCYTKLLRRCFCWR